MPGTFLCISDSHTDRLADLSLSVMLRQMAFAVEMLRFTSRNMPVARYALPYDKEPLNALAFSGPLCKEMSLGMA